MKQKKWLFIVSNTARIYHSAIHSCYFFFLFTHTGFQRLSRNSLMLNYQYYVLSRWEKQIKGFTNNTVRRIHSRLLYLLVHFLWRLHIWKIMQTKNVMFLSHFLLFSLWNNRRKRTDWTIITSIQFISGVWTCHYRNFPLDCREQRFCDSFLISFKLFVSFNVKGNMLEHLPEMKEKKRKTTEINDCSAWMILAIVFFSKSVLKWYDILMLDWAATNNNAYSLI